MKRWRGVSLGVSGAVVMLGGLTACHHEPAYYPVDNRSQAQKADACVERYEPDGKAPQVMTYDSETSTEVHLNQDGKVVTVTAQNKPDATSFGVEGKVGGARPESCTDATIGRSYTRSDEYTPPQQRRRGWFR
ncbi:MAG: hypothetical protein AAGC58_13755 [Asticcacaulis sp.]